jgi:hypothetical protein
VELFGYGSPFYIKHTMRMMTTDHSKFHDIPLSITFPTLAIPVEARMRERGGETEGTDQLLVVVE